MDKYAIAQLLREIGTAIELIGDEPKKGIAYLRAARALESTEEFETLLLQGSLESIPGIGKKIAGMIVAISRSGELSYHQQLIKKVPEGFFELMQIPGLSPSKIRMLYETYHISTTQELKDLFSQQELSLKGFGPVYRQKILKQISKLSSEGVTMLYPPALGIVRALLEILRDFAEKLEITGDLRRKLEIVSHIDLLAVPKNAVELVHVFTHHPLVKKVISQYTNEVTVMLKQGLKARLYLCETAEFPFMLLTTTGNQLHLAELKKEALQAGYQLENQSLKFPRSVHIHKIEQETEIYRQLKLPFIPPEVREGYGEIDTSKKKEWKLIEDKDLRGVFHCHTTYSDGRNTLLEMAQASKNRGWEYIGISDHSKSLSLAGGMSEEKLYEQIKSIGALNQSENAAAYIFSGLECDILKNGELDFSNEILEQLDFVIVSIHSLFKLEEKQMTERMIRAIENPYTTIIGHPTGRLLKHRDPYQINLDKVIDACIANHKVIELNGYPSRLDMDWRRWIKAKEKGLQCCISADAHSIHDFINCSYAINMARKGWLEKEDVINTLSLQEMQAFLSR